MATPSENMMTEAVPEILLTINHLDNNEMLKVSKEQLVDKEAPNVVNARDRLQSNEDAKVVKAAEKVVGTLDQRCPKFMAGKTARANWSKPIKEGDSIGIEEFNAGCDNVFTPSARITLDDGKRRQTTIQAIPLSDEAWGENREKVYIISRNGEVMKIGGTRTGMKNRFGSYLCGHHVCERGKSGKMSVTNAHLYHTIEADLLGTDSVWEFHTWTLPVIQHTINILGMETTVTAQTFHAYESCCIKKYKSISGKIPFLCDNCDPSY